MKKQNRVYLIRHGQVEGYELFPIYGHTDVDLTETGILQSQQMAERLRFVKAKAIYSSNLRRSVIGARYIAQYHDVPLLALEDLREIHFGEWEGRTIADIHEQFPEELKLRGEDLVHFQPPGQGESVFQFSERINRCFERIKTDLGEGDMIIVAHGGVNRVILGQALGLDLAHIFRVQQDYGCLNIIDYLPEETYVQLLNG